MVLFSFLVRLYSQFNGEEKTDRVGALARVESEKEAEANGLIPVELRLV
jgi:hypothetical protein